ncbi:hypothetical protein EC991_007463 [Linnemannia zychae]|nr:hypothetical protein EC991_007463 [Linnemannia zychae]
MVPQFSRLTTLTMNLLVNDEHDILFLVKSLPELRSLKKLDLTITMELNDDWPQFIHAIVFGLPASIECLDIGLEDFDEFGYDQIGCLCPDEDDEDSSTEDATEDVNNRRLRNWKRFLNSQDQPPLEHLRSIHITSLTQVPFDDIAAIFARCPALVELHIPDLDQDLDIVSRVARCIGESCPMITRVYQHGRLNDDRGLTLAITNAVQEQQFELLRFSGLSGSDDLVEAALRRHSTVLRELRLTHCVRLLSKSIQKILSTGHVLEVFQIEPYRDAYCCLTLQDAISVEWVCKGMKQLRLSLSIGATVPPAEDVYYKRPGLIVFTTEEVERFSKLEALYRRIGSLMELEHLDLRAVAECSHPEDRNRYSSYDVSFDAMLSLGDESKGWPGNSNHSMGQLGPRRMRLG